MMFRSKAASSLTPTALSGKTVAHVPFVGEERYVIRIRRGAGNSGVSIPDESKKNSVSVDGENENPEKTASTQEETDCKNDDADEEQLLNSLVKAELKYGTAAVRTLADFEHLDTQMRREILGSATASVGEDGTYLPPLPLRKKGEKYRSLALPLQQFLEAVLQMPTAVRSAALASFLTTEAESLLENDADDETPESTKEHMYLEYLLPCVMQKHGYYDEAAFQPIPRLGPLVHSVEVVPPGWWIVWLFRIEGRPEGQVEFTVYIDQHTTKDDTSNEVEEEEESSDREPGSFQREEVYRQTCSIGSAQPFTGIYRFSPEVSQSTKATLQFSNVGSLALLRGSRVHLECTAVPHQAFRAACEAAREQNGRDDRRHRAPLLYAILDSHLEKEGGGGVSLFVEPFSDETRMVVPVEAHNEDRPDAVPFSDDSAETLPTIVAEKDEELDELRAEVSKLHEERDYIRGELSRITQLADDGKRKLQLLVSEKRVWSVAREEIQVELSRLSAELEAEREMKNEALTGLETSREDVQRLHEEVKFLECQVPSEEDEDRERVLVEQNQTDVNEMKEIVGELEEEVGALKAQNAALEETLDEQEITCKELVAKARAEVDSRFSVELEAEREMKNEALFELETSKQEVQRLHREVETLECQVPTKEDNYRQRELVEQNQTEMKEMRDVVGELEEEVGALKAKNVALEEMLDEQEKTCKEREAAAQAEVDEARKSHSILEGKLRRFEKGQHRSSEKRSSRKKVNKTAEPVESTSCRKNQQLTGLQERHAQLVKVLQKDPDNPRITELIERIEQAIYEIVADEAKAGD